MVSKTVLYPSVVCIFWPISYDWVLTFVMMGLVWYEE